MTEWLEQQNQHGEQYSISLAFLSNTTQFTVYFAYFQSSSYAYIFSKPCWQVKKCVTMETGGRACILYRSLQGMGLHKILLIYMYVFTGSRSWQLQDIECTYVGKILLAVLYESTCESIFHYLVFLKKKLGFFVT